MLLNQVQHRLQREIIKQVQINYLLYLHVTGLSMGGSGAWSLAADYSNKFAAIAPICSGGNPEKHMQLTHTPIWAFHGEDDDVTPVKQV